MYLPGGGCTCLEGGTCLGGCTCLEGGVPAWRGVYLPGGGCTCLEGGVPAWRGVYLPGGYLPGGGVPAWRGGVPAWRGGVSAGGRDSCWGGVPARGVCLVRYSPPPVNRMTDACENITLAKTSFRPVKITHS